MRNKRTKKKKKDFPHTKGKTRNRRLKHLFSSFSRGKNYFSENNRKASVGEEKRKIHVVGNRCEEGNFLTGSDQKFSSGGEKRRSENSKRSVLARTGFLQQQDYYLPTGGGEGRGKEPLDPKRETGEGTNGQEFQLLKLCKLPFPSPQTVTSFVQKERDTTCHAYQVRR